MNTRTIEKYYAKQHRNRALIFSLIMHGIVIIGIAIWLLKPLTEIEQDHIAVEFVQPPERIHLPKKVVPPVEQQDGTSTPSLPGPSQLFSPSSALSRVTIPKFEPPPDSTVADLEPVSESDLIKTDSPLVEKGSGEIDDGRDLGRTLSEKTGGSSSGDGKGLGNFTGSGSGGSDAFGGEGVKDIVQGYKNDIGDELDSVIDEEGGIVRGHIRLIRLKHDMSDWWQDPTAIPSLIKWMQEHVKTISADMDYEGGALRLTDKKIMSAPLIIMTGHDQAMSVAYQRLADHNSQTSGFSSEERAALRKYILDYNGMLFFDYCGSGGNEKSFATLVEGELRSVFREYPLTTLDIQHEIFQCYFKLERTPVGGSWFWGTGYKGGNKKYRYIKGISVPGRLGKDRLAVVFCPLDYLCSMETAEIDSRAPLSARRSSDVYRFMTNMFVYQMRQRTDNQ